MANKQIGTLGAINTITVGGVVFTDIPNLIVLNAPITSTNTRATLRKMNGSTGYQVTSGKTFYILAIKNISASAVNFNVNLAQIDADTGVDNTTAFTNPFYTSNNANNFILQNQATAGLITETSLYFTIAATKFVGVERTGTGTCYIQVYGFEL